MAENLTLERGDPAYPEPLARIAGAPAKLRIRGDLGPPGARRIAVVGTRLADAYGKELTTLLAGELARLGLTIVSGGAAGIDTFAHEAALDEGGHTIAVLGHGLDFVFPPENGRLFRRIVQSGGALVSQFEDTIEPTHFTFPKRNAVISGLSDAVIVVQAPAKSGALITAEHAMKQGVPVFAVPGDARDGLSAGCIELLRRGARVAVTAADVLVPLGLMLPEAAQAELPLGGSPPHLRPVAGGLPDEAVALLEVLGEQPRHADEVARDAGLPTGSALAALLALELEGLCEQRPGHYFLRRR